MAHKTKMRLLQISGALDGGNAAAFEFIDGSGISNQSYLRFDTVAGQTEFDAPIATTATVTVGVDDTGHDVKFFGASTGKSLLWDESEDSLVITGDASDALKVAGGVDIDGVINVGADQDGYDVKFFGNTTGEYMLWDESADELVLALTSKLSFHDAAGGENIAATGDGALAINAGTSLSTTAPTQTLTATTAVNLTTDTVKIESLNPSDPLFLVKNTNADAGGARIRLAKDGASAAANDVLGELQFWGEDADSNVQEFGVISVQSSAITGGSETGKMLFGLASSDDGTVDTVLTIAAGADATGSTMTVAGNLTVNGVTTTIESSTLIVADKNIEMGVVDVPSDVTANGGGITLKGASDKTIIWDNANDNWTSNQDWNIANTKVYKINNVSILSATALANTVSVELPSLDINGGTDVGEALVDADELIVYNASASANRKMAMSRLSTFIAAGSTSKAVYVATASVSANNDIQVPGAIVASDWSNAASGSAEVYLNGQLLLSGGLVGTNFDYYQSVAAGRADPPGRVKFEFDIEENDVLQFILRS